MELQGCCAGYLNSISVGRFGLASKATWTLVEGRLAEEKAAHARAMPFEKSKHDALVTYRNPTDGSKLLTFSDGGHGAKKLFKCSARARRARSAPLAQPSSTSRATSRRRSTGSTGALSPSARRSRPTLSGRPLRP